MGRKQKGAGLELKKNWPGYLLLAPAVIAVLALSIYPLCRGIYLSFVNYNLVRPKAVSYTHLAAYWQPFCDTLDDAQNDCL